MDGGETSANIYFGQDSNITDVYNSKDNSGAEFLGAFKARVCKKGVQTRLIADNAPFYRGWSVTKFFQRSCCFNMVM